MNGAFEIMMRNLQGKTGTEKLEAAVIKEEEINKLRNKLRKELMKEMEKSTYDPKRDGWYKDLVHLCEKLGDHIINVSEALTGELERDVKKELIV